MRIISFDIETSPFSFFAPVFNFGGLYDGQSEIYFETPQAMAKYILSTKEDTIYIAHNLQFDFHLIFSPQPENELHGYNFNYSTQERTEFYLPPAYKYRIFAVNGQHPRFVSIERSIRWKENGKRKHKRVRIYLIDLMNFLKFSLAELMRIFTPDLTKTKEFGLERNLADIQATYRIFHEHFFKVRISKKREIPFFSIASLAFSDLVDRTGYEWQDTYKCANGLKRKYRPKDLVKIEQDSYHGGIVYPNPKYLFKKVKKAKYYDINSMYPKIMRDLKVPIGVLSISSTIELSDSESREQINNDFFKENSFCLYKINATTTEPILPAKMDNGKLELPIADISGWFCENELYPALFNDSGREKIKHINIVKIIRYKAVKGLFSPFVDYWYNIKRNYSGKGDKYLPAIQEAKLMLNSAYGRFAMRERETKMDLTDELKKELLEDNISIYIDADQKEWFVRNENNIIFLERKSEKEHPQAITIIASAITGGARGLIMRFFHPIKTIYIDTDSQTRVDVIPTGLELGEWKIEKEGTIQVFGKKHYEFTTEDGKKSLRLKGVPRKAKQLTTSSFEFFRLIKPRESIRRKLPLYSAIKVIKQLRGIPDE